MVIVSYVSGHGFGHAARAVEVMNALLRRETSVRLLVRTTAPAWFLDASLAAPVERIDGDTDSGVVQPDNLSVDEDETARRAAAFYASFDERVSRERDILRRVGADLVVGDIPPLAFVAATAAGLPSVAITNFTWDWIYEAYPRFDEIAPGVRALVAAAYAQATRTLRLPFWGGFASMAPIEDIPLVARYARLERDETRRRLGLDGRPPLVLATFGGHGGHVPLDRAAAQGGLTVVATDYELGGRAVSPDGPRIVSREQLRSAGVTYTDLLGACDVVVSKLGYGIVSECVANGVPLLYTTRGRFREQDIFERELPSYARCRPIARESLRDGDWGPGVQALLAQPPPPAQMAVDGADTAARRVLEVIAQGG